MLHIRRRREPVASWTARGWPPLLRWDDAPDVVPWLYWALNEVGSAADAHDVDAVEDLLAEAGILLERVWTDPVTPAGSSRRTDMMAISTALWSEVQRGRGIEDLTQVALHARLLRHLASPSAGQIPVRPVGAVPAYRSVEMRISGGRLPLTTRPVAITGRPLHEQFLMLVAAVLSNGAGHLSDYRLPRCPPGTEPTRTGWARRDGAPAGTRLGSIRVEDGQDGGNLLLRPKPCLTAVRRAWPAGNEAEMSSIDEVGWALAASWLTDTTLVVDDTMLTRTHTAAAPVMADHRPEQLWRLPLTVFHPDQFYPQPLHPQLRRGRSSNPVLRPVPER